VPLVQAFQEVIVRFGRLLYLKPKAVRRVAKSTTPAASGRIRLNEVRQRHSQPHRRVGEASKLLSRPWEIVRMHFSEAALLERLDSRLNKQGKRIATTTDCPSEARHPKPVAPNERLG
jgi:hypothetical protein